MCRSFDRTPQTVDRDQLLSTGTSQLLCPLFARQIALPGQERGLFTETVCSFTWERSLNMAGLFFPADHKEPTICIVSAVREELLFSCFSAKAACGRAHDFLCEATSLHTRPRYLFSAHHAEMPDLCLSAPSPPICPLLTLQGWSITARG